MQNAMKSLLFPTALVFLLQSSPAFASLDMDCRKTQAGSTTTLECNFTWGFWDEIIYPMGFMSSQAWVGGQTSPILDDGFDPEGQPDNTRTHYLVWSSPGAYTMWATGSLAYLAMYPEVPEAELQFHPDSPQYDEVTAPLP